MIGFKKSASLTNFLAIASLHGMGVLAFEIFQQKTFGDIDSKCTIDMSNGSLITVYYDPMTDLMNMIARVKQGSYAGWGWGGSMWYTEMVIFSADGENSSVGNNYST